MKALIFGEILYDVYENMPVIGGAPFNFAIQLSRMAEEKDVVMISAVGNDELGAKALELAKKEGINTACIEVLTEFDTGKALVFLNENKIPDYELVENVAWDNISLNEPIIKALEAEYDIFYCNLLAQRFQRSANTLKSIMQRLKAKIKVFDMTLRKSYFTKEKLEDSLHFANVLKINEEEFALIKKLFYADSKADERQILSFIQKDFSLPYIFLTLGENGACLQSQTGFFSQKVEKPVKVVDTLGAGDAFCAAFVYALFKGTLEDKEILNFASKVATQMVQVQGGTARIDFKALKEEFFKG